jgi:hypothetical protein
MNTFPHDIHRDAKVLSKSESAYFFSRTLRFSVRKKQLHMSASVRWCLALIFLWPGLGWTFPIGSRVRCNDSGVNVRNTAGGSISGQQNQNVQGTVTGGPTNASVGGISYTWYNVNFDSGPDGWVASSFLSAASLPRPSVSSVSPVSLVGSNSSRMFTINGANFISGSLVQVQGDWLEVAGG